MHVVEPLISNMDVSKAKVDQAELESYKFEKLPLEKVVLACVFEVPQPHDAKTLLSVFEEFERRGFELFSLEAGYNRNLVPLISGGGRGLVMIDHAKSMQAEMREDALVLQYFSTGTSKYEGYLSLLDHFKALSGFNTGKIKIAEIQYEVKTDHEIPKQNPWNWISDEYIPKRVSGDEPTAALTLQFDITDSFQWTANIISQRTSDTSGSMTIQTVGKGITASNDHAIDTLGRVHDGMRSEFLNLITDAARSDWGYTCQK